ncbi:hypothetical protein N7449_004403 [Penicillium cf. viridicatum]|uniref:Uncharacterized protein n=1 Tax=Penicillium cf. viridicatum TaxID=2972119 RepID=A0A9W9SXY3_9EURO|nr:hypothetical protein N7449_004403 [Penicillium cf. viridicatum]
MATLTPAGGENNSRNNVTNRPRYRRNNRSRSGDNSPTIEQVESDAETEGQNNRRNNADNRHHRNNSHISDDMPPGIERVGSDTEE